MSTETVNTEVAEDKVLAGMGMFGQSVETVSENNAEEVYEGKKFVGYLNLNPQGSKDGNDSAIIKLLPNFVEGEKNIKTKISYKIVTDDEATRNFMFDSVKSLGWTKENVCPIVSLWDTIKPVKKGDPLSPVAKKFKEHFQYKKPHILMVQVLEYDTNPELVGTIMPLRVTEDIEKLIDVTLNPSAKDIKFNDAVRHNPYDFFTGKALLLDAVTKDNGSAKAGRDFSGSKFVKAKGMQKFLVPQKDAEGVVVTKLVGENEVVQYDEISLTDAERTQYEAKDFSGTVGEKIQRILAHLNDENTAKLQDFGYNAPNDKKMSDVKELLAKFSANEPIILDGATSVAQAKTEDENAENTEKVTETVTENVSEDDVMDIVEQASATA